MAAVLLCGTFSASAASTSVPASLAAAVIRDPDVAPCFERAHAASTVAYVGANFQRASVTLKDGTRMSVISGGDSCVCGNANCKVAVFRHDGDAYTPVLSDYAIGSDVRTDGTAVVTSHDSAAVVYRTTYRWNGNKYAVTKTEMVYLPKNVAKPARRTLAFAPGKSSAIVSGDRVALGFEDYIEFNATAGQTATLTLLKHDAHFESLSLLRNGSRLATAKQGSLRAKLPESGSYEIEIEGADESLSRYALNVSIH